MSEFKMDKNKKKINLHQNVELTSLYRQDVTSIQFSTNFVQKHEKRN